MSHELVFRKDAEGNETNEARMILRAQGWHKLAKVSDEIDLALVHETLGTESQVEVTPLTYPDGRKSTFAQGVTWEGTELGVVGPSWQPLQNKSFVDSFAPWLDAGMVIEGAGLLRGGSVIYLQLSPSDDEPIEVRKNDAVRSRVFGVNGHDGKTGMRVGSCDERIVCANTLGVALREVKTDEEAGKANGFSRKHVGNVIFKMTEIQGSLARQRAALIKNVEAWKFLDSKPVKDTATVYQFSRQIAGKPADLGVDFKPSKVDMEIERLFRMGKGNLGLSFWDLLNAATEKNSHGDGNNLADDRPGDKEARRLDALWLGPLAVANNKAFSVAMSMAKAA
jgi:hypothetical protein